MSIEEFGYADLLLKTEGGVKPGVCGNYRNGYCGDSNKGCDGCYAETISRHDSDCE